MYTTFETKNLFWIRWKCSLFRNCFLNFLLYLFQLISKNNFHCISNWCISWIFILAWYYSHIDYYFWNFVYCFSCFNFVIDLETHSCPRKTTYSLKNFLTCKSLVYSKLTSLNKYQPNSKLVCTLIIQPTTLIRRIYSVQYSLVATCTVTCTVCSVANLQQAK